jgi:hypothetical protein
MSTVFDTEPRNTPELIQRIRQARWALKQTFSQLNEAQMVVPGPDGGWSVKDHLAHLTTWERGIVALLRHQPRWEAMGVDEATIQRVDEDGLNAILDRQNKDRSLADVLAGFEQVHRDMIDVLQSLSFDDLLKPYAYFESAQAGEGGPPVLGRIIGNTYYHYNEHTSWISAIAEHVAAGG